MERGFASFEIGYCSIPHTTPGSPRERVTIHDLPVELLRLIADHLDGGSRASLALVDKHMLKVFGTGAVNRDQVSRLQLLQIFDRCNMYPDMILCSMWSKIDGEPLDWGSDVELKPCESVVEWASGFISFSMVTAIMQSHRRADSRFPRSLLDSHKIYDLGGGDPTYTFQRTTRVVHGRLMMKLTIWVLPSKNISEDLLKGVGSLLHGLQIHREVANPCAHISWSQLYPFTIPSNYPAPKNDIFKCIWEHPLDCDKRQCGELRTNLNVVRGCTACYTDFNLIKCDMIQPKNQRVLQFTTWKDFGEGRTHADHLWQSHINPNCRSLYPQVYLSSSYPVGGISRF
ncbi:unnamed protein product [Parascedosporium putredinis]|uniref:F-box domain-containing protein n=1 Tax=Parascedosporium putredinis TaxID=1442378 RepID=A0A9P1MC57_9PEZI|nr:unnamed protein product [Parascedosporium putredinis]CAI7997786.1 unnamed protein product [Parascedosporium putredinis]